VDLKLILISVIGILVIGCTENPITIRENNKQGFTLSAYFNGDVSDSSLYIGIRFDGIQYNFPKVTINNQLIDSGYSPDYFSYKIPKFKDRSFTYSIEFKDDKIADTILIPGRIDSLHCNGMLLKDSMSVTIDSSSKYQFTWKKEKNSVQYSIQIWSIISDDINKIIRDTSIIFIPNRNTPEFSSSIYGNLYLCGSSYPEINLHSKPNKETDRLFIYYDGINGPFKVINFTIE
jgi:hypothetical protein